MEKLENRAGSNIGSLYIIKGDDKKSFFRCLQFIAFSLTQIASTEFFLNQPYSVVNLIEIKNKNQYQRESG